MGTGIKMVLTREKLIRECYGDLMPETHCLVSSYNDQFYDSGRKGLVSSSSRGLKENLSISPLVEANLSPIGLDLVVGDVYRSNCLRLLENISELFDMEMIMPDKNGKILLEPNLDGKNIYYIASQEEIFLPSKFSLMVDAKSSSGRVALMCTDQSRNILRRFSTAWPLVVAAQPYSFPLLIHPGKTKLFQTAIRLKNSGFMGPEEVVASEEIGLFDKQTQLSKEEFATEHGLRMTYHTDFALRAKLLSQIPEPIDMDVIGKYNVLDFYDYIEGNGKIKMDSKRFYLMGTRETIRQGSVCGNLSRETKETGTGLWGHFAGIIQPGFRGPITMECRSESPRIIREGDEAGFVRLDNLEVPLDNLVSGYGGFYQNQKVPMAPKMFKELALK